LRDLAATVRWDPVAAEKLEDLLISNQNGDGEVVETIWRMDISKDKIFMRMPTLQYSISW